MCMTSTPDLDKLRTELDDIDRNLVELIARRLETVTAVGEAKANTSAPVRDVERERAVLETVEAQARRYGVSGELVRRLFRELIGHAVDRQSAELITTSTRVVTVGYPGG